MPSCVNCKHYESDYEESDGHIISSWATCHARFGVSNLKQFPFRNTECKVFEDSRNNRLRNERYTSCHGS